jgi:alkylation response protein AidB-like acyl-CoA dehydrogenase
VEVLELLTERISSDLVGAGSVGPEASILKLYFSELLQRFTGLGARARGLAAQVDHHHRVDIGYVTGDWMLDHIRSWTWTIAAGSSEIQRNIIAERVLGLPREPGG